MHAYLNIATKIQLNLIISVQVFLIFIIKKGARLADTPFKISFRELIKTPLLQQTIDGGSLSAEANISVHAFVK
jgi:hypothetical protein